MDLRIGESLQWGDRLEYPLGDEVNGRNFASIILCILEDNNIEIDDGTFLELGSGNGALLSEMKKTIGSNVRGIDASPRNVISGIKDNIIQSRIESMPFGDSSIQTLFSSNVFDPNVYDQDIESMTKEISRILGVGSIYIAMEGNFQELLIPQCSKFEMGNGFQIFTKAPRNKFVSPDLTLPPGKL